ncbi:MAG: PilZ domain-containing protein [Myxococcota bacterium]
MGKRSGQGKEGKLPRHLRASLQVRLEVNFGNHSFSTVSCNVAIGGTSFETPEELPVGKQINLLLYLPMAKGLELLKSSSRVVWSKRQPEGWLVGTAFEEFAPGGQRRLQEWLLAYVRDDKESPFFPSPPEPPPEQQQQPQRPKSRR